MLANANGILLISSGLGRYKQSAIFFGGVMKKFIKSITLVEWLIWSISVISIIVFFFVFKNTQYLYLVGSLIGATALIFVSKGNPIGQFLTIVFSVFYGIISYSFNYYGEMITYLGMSAPIALWALISWLRNPYKGNKSEVKVNSLSKKEWSLFLTAAVVITVSFFFVLQALNTANLIISTVSVLTSFLAAYLTARRSRFYAIGYAANDIVLIIMWSMASYENITYLPMVICFIAFFVTDTYGFINWSIMNKKQNAGEEKMFQKMRRFKQALNQDEIDQILRFNTAGVLALIDNNGYPYSVPLSYVYTNGAIYFHSAKTGHKIDAIKNCQKASFCIIDKDDVKPEKYTTFYKSVIAFGKVEIVNDNVDTLFAIKELGEKYYPNHSTELQKEIEKSQTAFLIIKFNIKHITGKQGIEMVK